MADDRDGGAMRSMGSSRELTADLRDRPPATRRGRRWSAYTSPDRGRPRRSVLDEGTRRKGPRRPRARWSRDARARHERAGTTPLIVDRMLPGLDGLSVRAARTATPRRSDAEREGPGEDRIAGLRAGGDDLVKPFAFSELMAGSTRWCGARTQSHLETTLRLADSRWTCSRARSRAAAGWSTSNRASSASRVPAAPRGWSRDHGAARNVWDYSFDPQTNVVDVHMSRLRRRSTPVRRSRSCRRCAAPATGCGRSRDRGGSTRR